MKVVVGMYERVWSGEVEGCEVTLDFIEERGLFYYCAKGDGALLSCRLCADPIDAGVMEGPGVARQIDTPLIPNGRDGAFLGRFAPTAHQMISLPALGSPLPIGRVTARIWSSMSWLSA